MFLCDTFIIWSLQKIHKNFCTYAVALLDFRYKMIRRLGMDEFQHLEIKFYFHR